MPTDARTFSGYSRQVTLAIAARNALRREYSLKQVRPLDLFRGAFQFKRRGLRPKLSIDRRWMWSQKGTELLDRRLAQMLRSQGERGDFLQFGTVCEVPPELGRHCVQLDMTIPQAHRAGKFAVAGLSDKQVEEAIAVQRRVMHSAHHVFASTNWARESVVDEFGIAPDRVSVLYTGANLKLPTDLVVEKKPHQILFVGIDWERKGGPELVEGFRLLRNRLPDAELVIVGCSPKVDCPGVRVAGYLHPGQAEDQRRLASLYLESSCFAMMSDFEPMGIVFIEAYYAGLPVVAYDSGSRGELIENGKSGVLCTDRSPQTIADALYRVISDPDLRNSMAREARRLAAEVFTWDKVVDRIAEVLSVPAGGQRPRVADAPRGLAMASS
jgi:glycosyltransferase involved in cell wall biosynthesis